MIKIKKIIIDRGACIGAATCAALAPQVFKMDNENKAELLGSWTQEEAQMIIDAAKSCPVDAITVIGENDEVIWPKKQ